MITFNIYKKPKKILRNHGNISATYYAKSSETNPLYINCFKETGKRLYINI